MSAFAGNNLNFAITIGAKDTSASTLRGVAQRYLSLAKTIAKPISIPIRLARRGMAFARDFELGLRPIIAAVDQMIERGSGLEVVQKSFQALTETGGKRAEMLARQMRDAASGTIRLGRAMEIANRGLASGLSFDQLITAMDFVSKKAITTGMSADGAIDKVITGLARGSALFLDDFGLVVDGIEGIAREYDKIKGAGAFDELGPAAQKAAIVNQAIKEMREQLGKIGVSGKESIFIWQGLKNQIGDSVDKLVLAVAKSKSLRNVLEGFRNILSGITRHLEEGGSLWDVLLGKKNEKDERSGGLLGIAKAAALDAGEWIGRGILGGLLVGISEIPDVFSRIWDGLKSILDEALNKIPAKIQEGIDWLKGKFPDVAAAHEEATNWLGEWIQKAFPGLYNHAGPDGRIRQGIVETGMSLINPPPGEPGITDFPGMVGEIFRLGWRHFVNGERKNAIDAVEVESGKRCRITLPESDRVEQQVGTAPHSLPAIIAMAAGVSALASPSAATEESPAPSWFELAGEAGRKILSGGNYRFGRAVDEFLKQFPPRTPEAYKFHVKPDETLPLTPRGRVMREQENVLEKRRLRKIESDARREAKVRAAEEVRRLRLQGYDATGMRAEIERRVLDELLGQNPAYTEGQAKIEANRKALVDPSIERRRAILGPNPHFPSLDQTPTAQAKPSADDRGPMSADKSLDDLVKAVKENTQQSKQVYAALTGASSQMAQSA